MHQNIYFSICYIINEGNKINYIKIKTPQILPFHIISIFESSFSCSPSILVLDILNLFKLKTNFIGGFYSATKKPTMLNR